MDEKYASLFKNGTWEFMPLPQGKNVVHCKWVYKFKYKSNSSIEWYKAHLVAKGYSQKTCVDYLEM
jgi:hypothetical protein